MNVKLIDNVEEKESIARKILRDLPEWFGIEESTLEYIENVRRYPFVVAYDKDTPVGFYSVREENSDVLDMYVLGVLKKYHNRGVGTKLQSFVEDYARRKEYRFLMVLTLAEKVQNEEYLLTRKFYLKQGFIDFYQNDDIFDKNNPCQIMIKNI